MGVQPRLLEFVSIPNGRPQPFRLHPLEHSRLHLKWFQSPTGVPNHLDHSHETDPLLFIVVSIPNGRPQPFRLPAAAGSGLLTILVSIPNGRPQPFRLSPCLVSS